MAEIRIQAVGKTNVSDLLMPARFRQEIVFFMTSPDVAGLPELGKDEYWIDAAEAQLCLDNFMVAVVSPLDAENKAELELTDYQEEFLEWVLANDVQHVRIA